ncbi:MAG TPA: phage tail protein [Longimicrobium sp.]|nr:phage tail protein [Longimicrobium sp.]
MGQIPVGSIAAYGAAVPTPADLPAGWLLCDGSAVSRDTYATLFAALGIINGEGDGTTTFNLPDYRGRFMRGVSDGTGRDKYATARSAPGPGGASGDTVGSTQGSYTAAPATAFTTDVQGAHSHDVPHLPNDSSWYQIAGGHYAQWNPNSVTSGPGGAHSHTITGGDPESRPLNLYVNFLVYAAYFPA